MRNKRLIVLLTVVMVLVLVVVTCGATFLVRNVYAYSYYGNGENGTENYDERVIAAAGIQMNSSMFFVDEAGIKTRVENTYPNVGVINVERRFPDIVTVNYVVYENSFQYKVEADENTYTYYRCYSSGRIGGTGASPSEGFFTVIPRGTVATAVGAYFQGEGGFDRTIVDMFISYLHNRGLNDAQISERISFIDLSRDGYVYIRTRAGCNIEIYGATTDFTSLLERGWSLFVDPNPQSGVTSKMTGLIKVWVSQASGEREIKSTYTARGGEIGKDENGKPKYYSDASYYIEHYVKPRQD